MLPDCDKAIVLLHEIYGINAHIQRTAATWRSRAKSMIRGIAEPPAMNRPPPSSRPGMTGSATRLAHPVGGLAVCPVEQPVVSLGNDLA